MSSEAAGLVAPAPAEQVVTANGNLAWRAPDYAHLTLDLLRVATALKTTRNNLFHGGKSTVAGWGQPRAYVNAAECRNNRA